MFMKQRKKQNKLSRNSSEKRHVNIYVLFCWHRFLAKYNLQRKSNLLLASMECFILLSASAVTVLYFVTVLATVSNSEINRTCICMSGD